MASKKRSKAPVAQPKAIAKRSGSSAYEGASSGRRLGNWVATKYGPATITYTNAEKLRDRSHDAIRNNPWAAKTKRIWESNSVGNGIKLQSHHPDPDVRAQIHSLFNAWCDESDHCGLMDFYGQQALAVGSAFEGGESFTRMIRMPIGSATIPLQLQVMEAEQLPMYLFTGQAFDSPNSVKNGIEFSPDGKRQAYHFYKAHPWDMSIWGSGSNEIQRIPADEIAHCFEVLRPGQIRGNPMLSTVLTKLYDLDQYEDAELLRKKVCALFAGFIQQESSEAQVLPQENTQGPVTETSLEPGTLNVLLPNEKVQFSTPPTDQGLSEFVKHVLRSVAAGVGVTYELLTGDLSSVNYSSIRAGILEFRRMIEAYQRRVVIFQFCRPIWKAFIEAAIFSGALDAPDYFTNPAPYLNVTWRTPKWGWVDPEKDLQSAKLEMRLGLNSQTAIILENGEDPSEVRAQIKKDAEENDELELIFDSDPRKTNDKGASPEGTSPPAPDGAKPLPPAKPSFQ